MKDLVSVIIPVYNGEKYLEACISSVLSQTYRKIELILVDDMSTDRSWEICCTYKKKDMRIKSTRTKRNQGAFFSRLQGLELASGKYVVFVDCDDWIEKEMMAFFVKEMQKGYDFISTGLIFEEEKTWVWAVDDVEYTGNIEEKWKFVEGILHKSDESYEVCPSSCAKCYDREFILSCMRKFPNTSSINKVYFEDALTTLICILESRTFKCYSALFYHYVRRKSSVTGTIRRQGLYDEMHHIQVMLDVLAAYDIYLDEEYISKVIFWRFIHKENALLAQIGRRITLFFIADVRPLLGKKIVLYGAGGVGQDFYAQLSRYENCQIVHWVDKRYKDIEYSFRKIESPDCLKKDYDVVLISVLSEDVAMHIKSELVSIGIKEEKILWEKPSLLDEPLRLASFRMNERKSHETCFGR